MTATKAKPAAPKTVLASLVDELGALEAELAPLRTKIARVEMLRKALRAAYDGRPADDTFECAGDRFIALVGARAAVRVIDFVALAKQLGLKAYARIATVTLAALEAHASCTVVASVVTTDLTGPRSIKVIERGPA